MFRRRRSSKNAEIFPEDIFLDSSNLPHFDDNQFEGRIEKAIPLRNIIVVGLFFGIVGIVYLYQIFNLQIIKGEEYKKIAENNHLNHALIFSERGAIIDRYGRLLAWNAVSEDQNDFSLRTYREKAGSHNIVGYVKYPKKDKSGYYYNTELTGSDGIEKYYNNLLLGQNGVKIIETDVHGNTYPGSLIKPMIKGQDLILTIDTDLQEAMYASIKEIAGRSGFKGGAGIIMDVNTGEILASVSFPEFDSNIMTDGKNVEKIESYFKNEANPFLDRVSGGLYTPGSIIKPFFALAALNEGIISPNKKIESTGELKVPNPYKPGEYTVFKDWKAHGFTDMKEAIAVSSDVYFYQIGGGFPGQKGLGIDRLDKYARMFGFGSSLKNSFFSGKAGIIPNQDWKKKNFNGDIWRLGDTYNTAIGQYGFQITPIQAVRAVAALANNGYLIEPQLIIASTTSEYIPQGGEKSIAALKQFGLQDQKSVNNKIDIDNVENFRIIRDGMRMTVTNGTMQVLNVPYVKVAGKTGTAQLGALKKYINSWAVGFWPSEKPKYAFAIMLEKGPKDAKYGGTAVFSLFLEWMNIYAKQYISDTARVKNNENQNDGGLGVSSTSSAMGSNSANGLSSSTLELINRAKINATNVNGPSPEIEITE